MVSECKNWLALPSRILLPSIPRTRRRPATYDVSGAPERRAMGAGQSNPAPSAPCHAACDRRWLSGTACHRGCLVCGRPVAVGGFTRLPRTRLWPPPHRVLPKSHKWPGYRGRGDEGRTNGVRPLHSAPSYLERSDLTLPARSAMSRWTALGPHALARSGRRERCPHLVDTGNE